MSKNQPSMRKNQPPLSLAEQLHHPFKRQSEIAQSLSSDSATGSLQGELKRSEQPWVKADGTETTLRPIGAASQIQAQHKSGGSMVLVPDSKMTLAAAASTMQAHFGGLSHPLFTQQKTPLNPDRPLDEATKPAPRYHEQLQHLLQSVTPVTKAIGAKLQHGDGYDNVDVDKGFGATTYRHNDGVDEASKFQHASPWALIASPDLASHLELLEAGGLIALPPQFFEPVAAFEPVVDNQAAINAADATGLSTTPQVVAIEAPVPVISAMPAMSITATKITSAVNHPGNAGKPVVPASRAKQSKALLRPLTDMTLLDLSDIYPICLQYPALTRYGFNHQTGGAHLTLTVPKGKRQDVGVELGVKVRVDGQALATLIPEISNDIFSPNWEVILYPERFDNGVDSLALDILACSVAVHILKQCPTRQTVNRSLTAQQICQHMRSYLLSQCNLHPQYESTYRQIRLFAGHVVFAAAYLGLKVAYSPRALLVAKDEHRQGIADSRLGQPIYTNVAASAALFTRYPNISSYYINGWC